MWFRSIVLVVVLVIVIGLLGGLFDCDYDDKHETNGTRLTTLRTGVALAKTELDAPACLRWASASGRSRPTAASGGDFRTIPSPGTLPGTNSLPMPLT